jgi:hypothetical protein
MTSKVYQNLQDSSAKSCFSQSRFLPKTLRNVLPLTFILLAGPAFATSGSSSTSAGSPSASAPRAAQQKAPTLPSVPVRAAGDFINSIGVNVHFNYYGSIYTNNTPLMLLSLEQLGIHHLRDAMCWQGSTPKNTYYIVHQQLAQMGFKTDYVMGMNQPMAQASAYPALVNDMEAVEPANEYDNSGDKNWVVNIQSQLSAIYSTFHPKGAASPITVLGPSLANPWNAPALGSVAKIADAGNLHGYFGGYNPVNNIASPATYLQMMQTNTPKLPTWVTETGYFAAPGPIFGSYGVTTAMQAIYSLRALMEYWNAGAARTYFYELADDFEPGENAADFHWGLLDQNGEPKPAFTGLANLTMLLQDPGPSFTPEPLPLSVQVSSPSVHYALLGKRDGSYYVAIWNEVNSYDFVKDVELTPPTQTITFQIGRTVLYNGTQQFDATGNFVTKPQLPTQTLVLPVTDKLQILTWILQ